MRHRRLRYGLAAGVLGTALVVAGCGGGGGGGGGAATPKPVQDRVTVTPETSTTPFALQAGMYRLNWKTTDCKSITVKVTGDTGYEREKTSGVPNFSWILTSVTDGNYTAQVTDGSCAKWEITIEKVG